MTTYEQLMSMKIQYQLALNEVLLSGYGGQGMVDALLECNIIEWELHILETCYGIEWLDFMEAN